MAKPNRPPVSADEWLFRRSFSDLTKKYMNPDGTATSRVFKLREKDNGELSVDVKGMTTPSDSVGDTSKFMLFEVANREVLGIGLSSFHDPCDLQTHGFENPAHAVIIGMEENDEVAPGLLARKSRRVYI